MQCGPCNIASFHSSVPRSSLSLSLHGRSIAMSAASGSSTGKRPRKKVVQSSLPLLQPTGRLSLVTCHCCRIRSMIHLVSKSDTNPRMVFYKYPNHRVRLHFLLDFDLFSVCFLTSVNLCNRLNQIFANTTTWKIDQTTTRMSCSELGTLSNVDSVSVNASE